MAKDRCDVNRIMSKERWEGDGEHMAQGGVQKVWQGAGDVENIRQWKGNAETVYMARVNGEHITVM